MASFCAPCAPALTARTSSVRGNKVVRNSAARQASAGKRVGATTVCSFDNGVGQLGPVYHMYAPKASPQAQQDRINYLNSRTETIKEHFATAMGVDDFLFRTEIGLAKAGFTGENTVALVSTCRDEVCTSVSDAIEGIFGASFATTALGGVVTCGVTGLGAFMSHSPVDPVSGKERYVFFAFPHIGIDASGDIGGIKRYGRPGRSCACGALAAVNGLINLRGQTPDETCKNPGAHEPLDPEYSILARRMLNAIDPDCMPAEGMDLVAVTKAAEAVIRSDLEQLIEAKVDKGMADYAVITGVQIHSSGVEGEDVAPNMEYIAPVSCYSVVDGVRSEIDLMAMDAPTPRLLHSIHSNGAAPIPLPEPTAEDLAKVGAMETAFSAN